jgi:cytochrome c553
LEPRNSVWSFIRGSFRSFFRNAKAAALILSGVSAVVFSGVTGAQDIGSRLVSCAACHGVDGNSKTSASPSLAGQPRTFLENQMIMIREGIRDIPAMKGQLDGVRDPEIIALAKYFSGLPLKPLDAPRKTALFERGAILSKQMLCGTCHLPDYRGRDQMPRLAGQREDYLLHSMRQFRDNQAIGRDTIMTASLYGISDTDLVAIAHYLAQLRID